MDHWNNPEYSSKPHSPVPGVENVAPRSDTSETLLPPTNVPTQSTSYAGTAEATKSYNEEVADIVGDGEEDSWEDLDDLKLEQQVLFVIMI